MNWYNTYKLAYNVNKDDVLALRLVREIFVVIKENMYKTTYKDLEVDEDCVLNLYVSCGNYEGLRYDTFNIRSSFNFSESGLFEPYILVNLSFLNRFSEKHFARLYYVLFDAIKHELGHYYQYKNRLRHIYDDLEDQQLPDTKPLNQFINMRNYLLSERELIPYIKGLVFTSKKQNKRFDIVVDESLDGLFFNNNIDFKNRSLMSSLGSRINELLSEVRNTVISVARQLYPYLRRET